MKLYTHQDWMQVALTKARMSGSAGDIPVGAIVVNASNQILAMAGNQKEQDQDPTAHAEILALRQAGSVLGCWRLDQCRLYVTLEPCLMCAAAIAQARIAAVIYGADDPKAGAVRSMLNLFQSPAIFHRPQVLAGICEQECHDLLVNWFQSLRIQD